MVHAVWLGLGSNLGDRLTILRTTLHRLGQELKIKKVSSVYETAPMYVSDQPWYLNLVLLADTHRYPDDVVDLCQGVERELGRERTIRYGPRLIDIDLLDWDQRAIESAKTVVPHPRLAERPFVLYPLREIDPEWRHPLTGRSVELMIRDLQTQQPTMIKAYSSKI